MFLLLSGKLPNGTRKQYLEIKSSRIFTDVVTVSVLCFVSLVGNYFLWQSKQQYKDDDLKFCIIRVWRDCSSKEVLWFNDVFDIHRDATMIKRIQKQTDNYNLELKAKTDSLMQNKLQNKKRKLDCGYKTFERGENISSFFSLYKTIYYICKLSDDIYGRSN